MANHFKWLRLSIVSCFSRCNRAPPGISGTSKVFVIASIFWRTAAFAQFTVPSKSLKKLIDIRFQHRGRFTYLRTTLANSSEASSPCYASQLMAFDAQTIQYEGLLSRCGQSPDAHLPDATRLNHVLPSFVHQSRTSTLIRVGKKQWASVHTTIFTVAFSSS